MHIQIQPLFPLMLTAVHLLWAADDQALVVRNAIARSSIIHAPFMVESLANSLLVELGMSSSLQNDLEKLTTMAKLELCADLSNKGSFSRGGRCAQVFADLTKLRNDYVHPKRSKNTNVEKEGEAYFIGVSQRWSGLGIAKNPEVWDVKDAHAVLAKVMDAMDEYLMDVIGICNRRIERILLHHVVGDGDSKTLVTVPEKPWSLTLPEGVSLPRFLARMESHDAHCMKEGMKPCANHAQQDDSDGLLSRR
ncbi:hypothetical protein [Agarivorans gilvus]|uniref:Apea-like HEPN domain-containing protein n=1 Tax=Agarivorans gilvus TaxID=680279 RepID=A0ABQ1I6I6_9ALTE|nr:hypothetical protein [Agarivorans gilvus]GGB21545.1 hypothetical protein GCM10007414_38670 [Agarivorans gilvus]